MRAVSKSALRSDFPGLLTEVPFQIPNLLVTSHEPRGVSNHPQVGVLLFSNLFRVTTKSTLKPRIDDTVFYHRLHRCNSLAIEYAFVSTFLNLRPFLYAGIILSMRPANEKWGYTVRCNAFLLTGHIHRILPVYVYIVNPVEWNVPS